MMRFDSLKIVLISSGVVAVALAMKISAPAAMEFAASHVPVMCASFKSLLRPPYLYVLVNGIIITIAASSRFNRDRSPQPPKLQSESESDSRTPEVPVVYDHRDREHVVHELTPAVVVVDRSVEAEPEAVEVEIDRFEDKFAISESTWTPPQSAIKSDDEIAVSSSTGAIIPDKETAVVESTWTPPLSDFPAARPLVSSRIGHRKPIRSSPEAGRPLRVAAKPKRHDTLENTWKMITEGRSMPLSRHMKKGETWENQSRQLVSVDSSVLDTSAMVVKSETLIDRTNRQQLPAVAVTSTSTAGSGRGKLRKEPSLSQDELNRRVEAFIKNFNEEMRLQRQESLNQYMEMVKRGSN